MRRYSRLVITAYARVRLMSSDSSVAATLRPETRQRIALEALAKSKPISHLATDYEVSRKFVYEQSGKAKLARSKSFEPTTPEHPVLFHLRGKGADEQKRLTYTTCSAEITGNKLTQKCQKRRDTVGKLRL